MNAPLLQPFHVDIGEDALEELRQRLDRTRWPDELPGVGWDYGMPRDYLRELAERWRHGFDWRAAEARLNEWPQFITTIDGQRVHFAHMRSPEPDATPLIMTHGWPGSIVEFTKIAGPLTDPRSHGGDPGQAFHLVLPSIPGFAFSGPTTETGWDHHRVARAFVELMRRLGYERYGAQGGDWGWAISREIGRLDSQRVIGVHVNQLSTAAQTAPPTAADLAGPQAPRVRASWQRWQEWERHRAAYAAIQATRPQTLAYGLTDSPVGQLAWIAEKFHEWADSPIDRDLVLANVTVYWLTRTAGSAARIYFERAAQNRPFEKSMVPTAYADFPRDNYVPLRHLAERYDNIVRWTEFDRGGHFPALEEPDLLVNDVREFFGSLPQAGPVPDTK